MARIRFDSVSKNYGGNAALDGLSLDVADGEFFVLLGPTGAGKTTALRLIAGLEKPGSGTIEIAGDDVSAWTAAERDVALVFQYYSLYPRYTVRQNLEFPLRSRTRAFTQAEIDERVNRASATLRISHLMDRKTDRLSGGEMQRVSIGRAIVREPRAFLMDEPLSNLDAKLREALRAELKQLQMRLKATFIYVTHDQVEAMSMGDKVGVLNKGKLVQVGTPWEIYNRPRDVFVAGFVGSPAINLLPANVTGRQALVFGGQLAIGLGFDAGNRKAILGVRSEDVRVGPQEPTEAFIHGVENHGMEKILTLRIQDIFLKATVPTTMSSVIDTQVKFGFDAGKVHCFDDVSGINLLQAN